VKKANKSTHPEDTAGLFVDGARNALHATSASQAANGGAGSLLGAVLALAHWRAAVAVAVAVAVGEFGLRMAAVSGELTSARKAFRRDVAEFGDCKRGAPTTRRSASRGEPSGILAVVDSAATVVGARIASLPAGAAR